MKKLILILTVILISLNVFSQDLITTGMTGAQVRSVLNTYLPLLNAGRFDSGIEVPATNPQGIRYGFISVRKYVTGGYASGYHGLEDNSKVNLTSGYVAYASFSCAVHFRGTSHVLHNVGFQSMPLIDTTCTSDFDRFDAFATGVQHLGSGTIAYLSGYHVLDPLGSNGTVTNNYGLKVENLTRGTNNYSIWTGTAQSYFGGKVTINQFLALTPQSSAPSPAAEGQVYAGTDHHLYYYNGTSWKQLDN
jgi:hypothetical protein